MVSLVAKILHRTLQLGSYAGRPFVDSAPGDNVRLWLAGLREHVAMLVREIDRASAALAETEGAPPEWSDVDRTLFKEFLARHYPNESDAAVHSALGEAWMDGRRADRQLSSEGDDSRAVYPASTSSK